jgi:hypothetical protein
MTTLAWSLSLEFNLALQDKKLIQERVRNRGGDLAACRWPGFWLEGTVADYFSPERPIRGRRRMLPEIVVLAEERQVFTSTRPTSSVKRIKQKWEAGLNVLGDVDDDAVVRLLTGDEQGFLVNMLVLVHEQPDGKIRPRPSMEESYRRHQGLMAELEPLAQAKRLPLSWHAVWRPPARMKWVGPSGQAWIRYPAVSFAMGVRPLQGSTDENRS